MIAAFAVDVVGERMSSTPVVVTPIADVNPLLCT